ncbi:MAG: hypothetical protein K0R67_486 [Paenibacillus sp.]|nr:hypothetical protein [Paenibacillus sp.]
MRTYWYLSLDTERSVIEIYVASCSQPQKIRQYGRRSRGFDLNRDDRIDQSHRVVLAEQRDQARDVCGSMYERDLDALAFAEENAQRCVLA